MVDRYAQVLSRSHLRLGGTLYFIILRDWNSKNVVNTHVKDDKNWLDSKKFLYFLLDISLIKNKRILIKTLAVDRAGVTGYRYHCLDFKQYNRRAG